MHGVIGSPITILQGDVSTMLPLLPSESINCVVTSPPYWGLRERPGWLQNNSDGARH